MTSISKLRKFHIGDTVKVSKSGRYENRFGMIGEVTDYRLRTYPRAGVMGSCYRVQFPDNTIWIETEYLTKKDNDNEHLDLS
jgi:hypothetical protein